MSFGSELKRLRLEKNWTQEQLAKKLNLSKANISKYESNTVQPNFETLTLIAALFEVSTDNLLGIDEQLLPPTITEDYVTFPVIGEVAAGFERIADEDWTGETVDVPLKYLHGRKKEDFFVLKVQGDSMYPLYHDGDTVLVLRQSTMNRSGEIGVIIYDGDNGTLKKIEYVEGEDWLKMIPINPEFQPKKVEGVNLELCRVVGIPKLLIREID